MGKRGKAKKGKARTGRSGNPAKRALEAQALAARAAGQALADDQAGAFELPKELRDLLPKDE